MAGKTLADRIAETERRIAELEARKQTLEARQKEQERKTRTRRLIQVGAILAHMGVDTLEKAQRVQRWYESNPRRLTSLRAIAEGTGLDGLTGTPAITPGDTSESEEATNPEQGPGRG